MFGSAVPTFEDIEKAFQLLGVLLALFLASVMAIGVEDILDTYRGISGKSLFWEATEVSLLGLLVAQPEFKAAKPRD